MKSTRVIELSQDLPAAPADHPGDRNHAASRARVQRRQPETLSPGDAALVALVRLLARQAAQEHVSQGE